MGKKVLNYILYSFCIVSVWLILYYFNALTGKLVYLNVQGGEYAKWLNVFTYIAFLIVLWHGYFFYIMLKKFMSENKDFLKVIFGILYIILFCILILQYLSPVLPAANFVLKIMPNLAARAHHMISLYLFIYMLFVFEKIKGRIAIKRSSNKI